MPNFVRGCPNKYRGLTLAPVLACSIKQTFEVSVFSED